jgi:hypothetical protein
MGAMLSLKRCSRLTRNCKTVVALGQEDQNIYGGNFRMRNSNDQSSYRIASTNGIAGQPPAIHMRELGLSVLGSHVSL